jgi:hypothetical protein
MTRVPFYLSYDCPTCGRPGGPRLWQGQATVVTCETCPPRLIGLPDGQPFLHAGRLTTNRLQGPRIPAPAVPDRTITGAADDWASLLTDELRARYDETLIARAIDRLTHGDIKDTRYGWRVALRPDLGDNRQEADAYWPEANECCLCWARNAHGACSHELAVILAKRQITR